jgi:hypothetical protein
MLYNNKHHNNHNNLKIIHSKIMFQIKTFQHQTKLNNHLIMILEMSILQIHKC